MSITVSLVTFNSHAVILDALASLQTVPEVSRIIVVDNNSADDTVARIQAKFPHIEILQSRANEGFGAGHNRALGITKTPFFCCMNPDARVENNTMLELKNTLQSAEDIGIVAPLLTTLDGRIQECGKKEVFLREQKAGRWIVPEAACCMPFIPAALWLCRTDLIERLGGFDPNIFLFYEDDDLCLRVRKAGYSVVLEPKAKAYHGKGGSSSASKKTSRVVEYHKIWSRCYLEKKYRNADSAKTLARRLGLHHLAKTLLYAVILNLKKSQKHYARTLGALGFARTC